MNVNTDIKAVLFDLDGTLLPMDQQVFLKTYLKSLAKYVAPMGIEANTLINSVLMGTKSMICNDGSRTNMEAFWETFFKLVGGERKELIEYIDDFYYGDFKLIREATSENPLARNAVDAAHRNGRKVVLATSPIFPMSAQIERASWVGLSESDFEFITSYEKEVFCKPSPEYYRSICDRLGVAPENCLMIGNDESDDMKGASEAGMRCFLVTDCRIMSDHFVWTGERGTFEQAVKLLERI